MKQSNKTIGVLGGMGPEASSNLYSRMIKYIQNTYDAVQDTDYPPIFIYSLPLFGFDETGIVDENLVRKQLINGVKKLESAGSDLIIIACNSVHLYYQEMQAAVHVPIFNIIEETKKRVEAAGFKKTGLFASESTGRLKLYQKSFSKAGIEVISPDYEQQKLLNRVIKHVMGGNQTDEDVTTLKNIGLEYKNRGAEAIVMGCTEIPLAIKQREIDMKLFDSIGIIVESAVDCSLK